MIKIPINPKKDLVFDERVVEACKACKRHGLCGCCPPCIGSFNYYKRVIRKYNNGVLIIRKFIIKDLLNWKELGRASSLDLHKHLLKERQKLLDNNIYLTALFGGGSCKVCKECSIPCKVPQYRIIPMEATGVNVVEVMKKQGINLEFPVKKLFYRIGLLLWNE